MLAFARTGKGRYASFAPESWRSRGDFLNRGQRLAVGGPAPHRLEAARANEAVQQRHQLRDPVRRRAAG